MPGYALQVYQPLCENNGKTINDTYGTPSNKQIGATFIPRTEGVIKSKQHVSYNAKSWLYTLNKGTGLQHNADTRIPNSLLSLLTSNANGSDVFCGEQRSLTLADSLHLTMPGHHLGHANRDTDLSSAHSHGGTQNKSSTDSDIGSSKVQLPSTHQDIYGHKSRCASMLSLRHSKELRLYHPVTLGHLFETNQPSRLSSHTFPPNNDKNFSLPRLNTDVNFSRSSGYDSSYLGPAHSNDATLSSSTSHSILYSSSVASKYVRSAGWGTSASGVPSGQALGQLYNHVVNVAGLPPDSFSRPIFQAPIPAGSAHISGQQGSSEVKSEFLFFPNQDSVQENPPSMASSSLPDRTTRRSGKLPKETTDLLKAWLRRHTLHPYPNQQEKKQLCLATGLSMTQVSGWMINVSVNGYCPVSLAYFIILRDY